jgi:hypothetical protein
MQLINIDNGGTFTDICVVNGEQVSYTKTITTPFDLSQCLFDGLAGLLQSTGYIRYSTSQGTSALVQRKGPRLGLFADAELSAYSTPTQCSSISPTCTPSRLPAGMAFEPRWAHGRAPGFPLRTPVLVKVTHRSRSGALDAASERTLLFVAGSLAECCETLPQFAPLWGEP